MTPVADPGLLLDYLRQALLAPQKLPLGVVLPQDADHTLTVAGAGGDNGLFAGSETVALAEATLANTVVSDGFYIYVAALPAVDLAFNLAAPATEESGTSGPDDGRIGVYEMLGAPSEMVKVTSIDNDQAQLPVAGLYLVEEAGAAGEPILASIASRPHNGWFFWNSSTYWRDRKTEVELYDVSAPTTPQILIHLEFDGQLIATRRVGEILYIVTRFTPTPAGFIAFAEGATDRDTNRRVLATAGLGDLMPTYSIDGGPRSPLLQPTDCFLIATEEFPDGRPDWLTITAIDVANPQHPVSKSVVGPSDTVHVAADTLYLAASHRDPRQPFVVPDAVTDAAPGGGDQPRVTEIHKFSFTAQGPAYRGSGTVDGFIDALAEEKPFTMSDYGQTLRIVTTMPASADEASCVRLSLLEEAIADDGTSYLLETGRIDHLEETVTGRFTAGFAGPVGYLVSREPAAFIRLLDLSRPEKPSVGGDIAVTGGGYRLFAMGGDAIIGIGRQAEVEAGDESARTPSVRWEGIELLLIDSADPLTPTLLDSLTIGWRGTESAARLQPQALYAEPPTRATPGRLALPIRLVGTSTSDARVGSSAYNDEVGMIHTDLYLFDVYLDRGSDGGSGFVARGVLGNASADDGQLDAWGGLDRENDRTLVAGEVIHYIHDGKILTALWPPPEGGSR